MVGVVQSHVLSGITSGIEVLMGIDSHSVLWPSFRQDTSYYAFMAILRAARVKSGVTWTWSGWKQGLTASGSREQGAFLEVAIYLWQASSSNRVSRSKGPARADLPESWEICRPSGAPGRGGRPSLGLAPQAGQPSPLQGESRSPCKGAAPIEDRGILGNASPSWTCV
jgi:hypothetical protein